MIKPFSGRTPDGCQLWRQRREDQIAAVVAAGAGGVARAAAAAHTRQFTYIRVYYGRARARDVRVQSHGPEDFERT